MLTTRRFIVSVLGTLLLWLPYSSSASNESLAPLADRETYPLDGTAIALPAGATDTERFAATELQRYIEQMSGRSLSLYNEEEPRPQQLIHLGRCVGAESFEHLTENPVRTLHAETAVIAPDGHDLHLFGGGDRGTLYAVYAFLEMQGCRWFEPGPTGEVIPNRTDLTIPMEPVVERPVFAVREIGRSASSPEEAERVIDWAVKNRLNRNFNLRMNPAWRKRGGQVAWQHICHNSPWLLPNDLWFESHPEYFSLYNGRRIPQGKEGGYLCTTHPDVQRIVADFIIRWFDNNPDGDAVPISPPDGDVKWCECDRCMALGGVNFASGPEGYMTRRQVEFINAVAALVAEKYPDRYLVNLAYSRYVWPYEGMRTASNVINQVAHGYAGNGSLVHSIRSPWNNDARDIFRQWAESGGAGIGIWDYFILHVPDQSGSPMTPLGFGAVAEDMINYLAAFPNPYKVYFTQAGDALQSFNPFLYYVIARTAWDPSKTLAALRADYTAQRFGPAASLIDRYLDLLDKAYEDADWNPPIWREITVPSARVFTPAFIEQGWSLLHEAQALLPAHHQPLARMITSLDYAETTVLPKQLIASADGVWHLIRGENAYEFNPGAGLEHEEQWRSIRERAQKKGLLDASMERVLFRTRSRQEPIHWLENDRVRLGVLPGVGGRLIRLMDRREGHNLLFEPFQLSSLTDPGATYFRYGGYEEYTRSAFASPGWELGMERVHVETNQPQSVRLEARTPESIHVVRHIDLSAGDEPVIHLRTELTNEGTSPFHAMIRVHPEFKLTDELEDTVIIWTDVQGRTHARPVSGGIEGGDEFQPAGRWGLFDRENGRGILNEYPKDEATAHLHLDRSLQALNLELFARETLLQTGESCSLEHTYRLVNGPDEMSDEVRAAWNKVRPQEETADHDVAYVPGHEGTGIRLGPTATPSYGKFTQALSEGGSFAAWIALDRPPQEESDALIMSAGSRQPDYLVLAIREGRLVFYRHQKTDSSTTGFTAWLKVDAELPRWKPASWHHVAVNWRMGEAGKSMLELYADGERLIARHDVHMVPFKEHMRIALGWDSSNAGRPRLAGVADGVRLYREPLPPEAVRLLYTGATPGDALLMLDFEERTR